MCHKPLTADSPQLVLPDIWAYTFAHMEQQNQTPRDDLTELPLFPLNLVLFPGMQLPLHIFEERYKAMIGDCIERDAPFGIVLIKEGPEVGGPAEPFRVGTTARIVNVQNLEEGRLNLLTQGERRFQVVEIIQQEPHLVGLIHYLEDDSAEISQALAEQVAAEYAIFSRHLVTMAGGWTRRVDVPGDPVRMANEAAASLASSLGLPPDIKQQLLESSTTQQLLERMLPLFKRGNELLQEQVEKNNPFRGARLN